MEVNDIRRIIAAVRNNSQVRESFELGNIFQALINAERYRLEDLDQMLIEAGIRRRSQNGYNHYILIDGED